MSERTCGQCGVPLGEGPGLHACEVRTYRCEVCGEDHRHEELATCYVKDMRRVGELERRMDALANRLDMLSDRVERSLERLKSGLGKEQVAGITAVGAGESLARAMEAPICRVCDLQPYGATCTCGRRSAATMLGEATALLERARTLCHAAGAGDVASRLTDMVEALGDRKREAEAREGRG